jgi:hypothetical protein
MCGTQSTKRGQVPQATETARPDGKADGSVDLVRSPGCYGTVASTGDSAVHEYSKLYFAAAHWQLVAKFSHL